jgi:hypothetical protein
VQAAEEPGLAWEWEQLVRFDPDFPLSKARFDPIFMGFNGEEDSICWGEG